MFDAIREATSYLWGFLKPHRAHDVDAQYFWAVRITVISMATLMVLIAHMFFAQAMPWDGPLAKTSQTAELDAKLNTLLEQSTNTYRLALGQEICKIYFLRKTATGDLYASLNTTYEEKQLAYKTINKNERYDITECAAPATT